MRELKPGRRKGNQDARERGSKGEFTSKTTAEGKKQGPEGTHPAQGTSISHRNACCSCSRPRLHSVYSQLSAKGSLSTEVKSYPISIKTLVMAPILPQVQILTGSHLPQG